jgi:hypothetical protein
MINLMRSFYFMLFYVKYLDTELLVNLVLNGQTVSIPSETTFNAVAGRMSISSYNILQHNQNMHFQLHIQYEDLSVSSRDLYLDGTCEQMTIMGKTSGEGRSVKESEGLFACV